MAAAASAVTAYRHILRRRAGLIALLLAAIFIALLADFTTGPSALSWAKWRALSAAAPIPAPASSSGTSVCRRP